MNDIQWQKRDKIGLQNSIIDPLLKTLKSVVDIEKAELERRLNNLKRLGVVSISKEEIDKRLKDIKIQG